MIKQFNKMYWELRRFSPTPMPSAKALSEYTAARLENQQKIDQVREVKRNSFVQFFLREQYILTIKRAAECGLREARLAELQLIPGEQYSSYHTLGDEFFKEFRDAGFQIIRDWDVVKVSWNV